MGEHQPEELSGDSLRHARRVLTEEADALRRIAERLDGVFAQAVQVLCDCTGRVVVTGMGKSGHVGRKIAATLASLGTPAFFLHPAEALHGDLGLVTEDDVVLALSYSGETDELLAILPALRRRGKTLVAMTGGVSSTLATAASLVLDVSIGREACPMNLAPTTSTTTMIALGDALAVAVMEAKGFTRSDYAQIHPAGSLGRRLLLRVSEVMRSGRELAVVHETVSVHDAILAVTQANAGAACVTDEAGKLTGILTDGDARRYLLSFGLESWTQPVREAMTREPRRVVGDPLAAEALDRFEHESGKGGNPIGDLPVVNEAGEPVGMLMLKDLVRAGIVVPDATA
ncbi:MAG: KpsF/GutQ family sugar-phosphate isomerase [Armatimonadota bacterium]